MRNKPYEEKTIPNGWWYVQISAQESRRKKKEYMDSLERKYDIIQSEANSWRAKAEALQVEMQFFKCVAPLWTCMSITYSMPMSVCLNRLISGA